MLPHDHRFTVISKRVTVFPGLALLLAALQILLFLKIFGVRVENQTMEH